MANEKKLEGKKIIVLYRPALNEVSKKSALSPRLRSRLARRNFNNSCTAERIIG